MDTVTIVAWFSDGSGKVETYQFTATQDIEIYKKIAELCSLSYNIKVYKNGEEVLSHP